jgi:hypothetical protein
MPSLSTCNTGLLSLSQDMLDAICSHSKLKPLVALSQTCKSLKRSIHIVPFKTKQLLEDLSDVYLMANKFVKDGELDIKTVQEEDSSCYAIGYSPQIFVSGTLRHESRGYVEPRVHVTSFEDDWFPLLEDLKQASPLLLGGLQAEAIEFFKYGGARGYSGGPMFRQIIPLRVVFRSDANVKLTAKGDLVMSPEGVIMEAVEDGSMKFTDHRTHVNWADIHMQCMQG